MAAYASLRRIPASVAVRQLGTICRGRAVASNGLRMDGAENRRSWLPECPSPGVMMFDQKPGRTGTIDRVRRKIFLNPWYIPVT